MNEKELRKLSRADLLQMLIDQGEELNALRERCAAAEAALKQREISINNAGSIAEAALQLNGVFEAAQAAAQQYLDNIKELSGKQKTEFEQFELESQEKAGRLLIETEKRCEKLEKETKIRCEQMTAKARLESQAYWDKVSEKLDAYYNQHVGLRELMAIISPIQAKEWD